MASDVISELAPGLNHFPTSRGQNYHFSGIVRGGLNDEDVATTLETNGFGDVVVFDVMPPNWPTEDLPPLGAGERYFRGTGTWTLNDGTPTSWSAPGGVITIFEMWTSALKEMQSDEPSIVPERPSVDYGMVNLPPEDAPYGSAGVSTATPDRSVGWSILGVMAMGAVAYGAMTLLDRTPRARRA